MRLAISNIAWDVADDVAVAALLKEHGVDAIDVAPGKYFPQPLAATAADIAQVRGTWEARGVEITGMQALLFGTQGLNLFGTPEVQAAMLAHLGAVCRIGGGLGATRLVFGSPRNRDRGSLDDEQVARTATDFFRRLGDIAAQHGVVVCLEPNPPVYGANFLTTSAETVAMVRLAGHPAVRMQLDTGAMVINGEDAAEVVAGCAAEIGHIHASEPQLVTLGEGGADHAAAAAAIRAGLPRHVVSIEMLAPKDGAALPAIARALAVARRHYGDPLEGATA